MRENWVFKKAWIFAIERPALGEIGVFSCDYIETKELECKFVMIEALNITEQEKFLFFS